jgi:hypothetical protein
MSGNADSRIDIIADQTLLPFNLSDIEFGCLCAHYISSRKLDFGAIEKNATIIVDSNSTIAVHRVVPFFHILFDSSIQWQPPYTLPGLPLSNLFL